jgi:hypothetical protein
MGVGPMSDCEICGEYLYADEEWKLSPGLQPGSERDPSTNYRERDGSGYVHARCLPGESE